MTPTYIRLLGISSVLHDIGKVGVDDTVLLKPGKLTESEHLKMQQHTLVGGECLSEIEQRLGASNFLQTARELALHHHERWDGKGYPNGLRGTEIPLCGRIVAVADVFDAITHERPYKVALPASSALDSIADQKGKQFDPTVANAFIRLMSRAQFDDRKA